MLRPHRPLRVAVLCSDSAPGLLYLLNRAPDRGETFEIVCVVSSDTFDEEVRVERRGVPTLRAGSDGETLERIEPYLPDVILLDGYREPVTPAMRAQFPGRVIDLRFDDLDAAGPLAAAALRSVKSAIVNDQLLEVS
jgi:folate-dependent phosphoribosylglycinamide formyltransferase PurN